MLANVEYWEKTRSTRYSQLSSLQFLCILAIGAYAFLGIKAPAPIPWLGVRTLFTLLVLFLLVGAKIIDIVYATEQQLHSQLNAALVMLDLEGKVESATNEKNRQIEVACEYARASGWWHLEISGMNLQWISILKAYDLQSHQVKFRVLKEHMKDWRMGKPKRQVK